MRRFLLSLLTLIILSVIGLYFIVLPGIKKDITQALEGNHFENIQISGTKLSVSGLDINKITGNNLIAQNIELKLYWPTYIFNRKVDNIEIEELTLNSNINFSNQNTAPLIKRKLALMDISSIPDLTIRSLSIQLSALTNVKGNLEKTENTIKGQFNANNENLSFQSEWSLEKDNQSNVTKFFTDIQNLNIKNKYIAVNRGKGWFSYESDKDTKINSQLESGSGSLLNAPLNNINFLIGKDTENHTLLLRANASGNPDITLKTDAEWSNDFDISLLKTYITFPSFKTLDTYLLNNKLITKALSLDITSPSNEITIEYLPERRFAQGPYPLKLKSSAENKYNLSGNILIYPDSYDVRGTLNGAEDVIKFMNDSLPINHQKVSSDTIRLEGNLTNIQKN